MAITSVAMETTVEFSHVSSLIWTIFTPFLASLLCLTFLLAKENIIFHLFSSKNYSGVNIG